MTQSSQKFLLRVEVNRVWKRLESHRLAILFLFATLLLIYPAFIVTLQDINPWDEAAYLHTGQMLLDEGAWPRYADNPFMALFYALLYLPVRASPYWMPIVCSLGRVILFILLWLSLYLVARRIERYAPPLVALGVFLAVPLSVSMLRFPSDPLFASMAGLSLWQFLGYYQARKASQVHAPSKVCQHLAWASFFMALAALSRNDGMVLFVIFLALALLFTLKDGLLKQKWGWVNLLAALLPFALLVSGYILVYGLATGNFDPGTLQRTYDNFETGHGTIYVAEKTDRLDMYQVQQEARRVFGTPEENHYSILNAVRRNPRVYANRVLAFSKTLPERALVAYGQRFSALLLLLCLRGVYEILRRKEPGLLLIFLLWPCHLASAFAITLVREGHLQFVYYLVFPLAAVGLWALITNLEHKLEKWIWIILLTLLALLTLVMNKLAIFYGAALMLGGLLAAYALWKWLRETQNWRGLAMFILLGAGLVLHGNYPSPFLPKWGSTAIDQGILFLQQHYTVGAPIGAASPGPVWAARMRFMGLAALDVPIDRNEIEFMQWLRGQKIQAIYVDATLYNTNSRLWSLLEPRIGKELERVFVGDEGDIQVLAVKPGP